MEPQEKKAIIDAIRVLNSSLLDAHDAILNTAINLHALKKFIETGEKPETVDIPLDFVSIPPSRRVKNKKKSIVSEQKEKIVDLIESGGSLFSENQATKSNPEDNINKPLTGDPEVF